MVGAGGVCHPWQNRNHWPHSISVAYCCIFVVVLEKYVWMAAITNQLRRFPYRVCWQLQRKKSKSYLIHMCRCSVDHLEDPQTLTDGFVKSFAVIFVTFLVEWNVGYLEVSLWWSVSSKGERWGMLNSCVLVLIYKTCNPNPRIVGVRYAFNKAEWMSLI